mmetsp:Transcript_37274/g.89114  ORF Transcript_37274/g.89114 Transcript_37274/m.89114 type:complete len:205 (-) Transcript_37274:1189-1803(-)
MVQLCHTLRKLFVIGTLHLVKILVSLSHQGALPLLMMPGAEAAVLQGLGLALDPLEAGLVDARGGVAPHLLLCHELGPCFEAGGKYAFGLTHRPLPQKQVMLLPDMLLMGRRLLRCHQELLFEALPVMRQMSFPVILVLLEFILVKPPCLQQSRLTAPEVEQARNEASPDDQLTLHVVQDLAVEVHQVMHCQEPRSGNHILRTV